MIYRIKDWNKHFEKAESRRVKTMSWVPVPTKHDGSGFRQVAAQDRAAEVFTAWILIVQTAAKMPTRGLLFKDGKPLSARDLHYRTGYPEEIFSRALTVLSNSEIGWLEVVAGSEIIDDPTYVEGCEIGAKNVQ